ncbi:hypothetical protein [Rouxiella chamberiensis]|uniref:DUF3077 domain-containing protein n=1 Tax=Rouxiella chamberiensis TaxID=1513468 RepID=A0ABY7HRQ3_9GAMM|nr:hypothetical protein [Rouxiella chamberiensis]WAT02091.1 hypothetical protein O1V66_05295 [Rouxiella chamberiensis]
MFTTPFWPAADSYHIHMMEISLPDSLSPAALDLIHQATRLAEAALAFLQCYSPHHQREEADLLLNRLGKTVDMIEYDQKIKGFTL